MKKVLVVFIAIFFLPFSLADNADNESVNINYDYVEGILNLINEEMVANYIQTLQDFGPRVTGQQSCWDAGNYIYNELKSYGYETHFINWSYGGYEDRNIEAILPGESEDSVIICAHYDSVSISPGADDNGSGTSAVLAAAKAISQYKDDIKLTYTIRFIAFSGEEEGLLGSYSYASHAYEENMAIVAVLNADMIGYTRDEAGKENVVVYDRQDSKWIANVAREVAEEYSLGLTIHEYNAGASSDHWPFIQHGYDAAFFHEYQFNDYYHSSEDTIDKMDLEYDARVTKLVVGTLLKIAQVEINDNEPPEISIERPGKYLYVADREVMPIENTVIIGKITLQMEASDILSGISKIEVYIDDELKVELKNKPYEWLWDEFAFFKHEIKAVAYDYAGNEAEEKMEVLIFNI